MHLYTSIMLTMVLYINTHVNTHVHTIQYTLHIHVHTCEYIHCTNIHKWTYFTTTHTLHTLVMVEGTVCAGVSCVAQVQFAITTVPHCVTATVMVSVATMSGCFLHWVLSELHWKVTELKDGRRKSCTASTSTGVVVSNEAS